MIKRPFFVLALVILAAAFYFLLIYLYSPRSLATQNFVNYSLGSKKYKLLVADERKEWVSGLSGLKRLPGYDGMIFIFPAKQKQTFWNQNTHLNLKLIWLADDKMVGISNLPAIEKTGEIKIVSSPVPVNRVIELVVR